MSQSDPSDRLPIHASFSSLSRDIGEDIECFAIERMLGHVDGYTDKENIRWDPRECVLVASGWWKERKHDFPPSPALAMAYIGFHWDWGEGLSYEQLMHFRRWQPIGCRDPETARRFSDMGVEARFTNCVTLGLERWVEPDPDGEILAVDVPETFALPRDVVSLSHKCQKNNHPQFVRSQTKEMLERYQRASLVVTTRLHAALACLAFGTPVAFVASELSPDLGAIIAHVDLVAPDHEGELVGNTLSKTLRKQWADKVRKTLLGAIKNAQDIHARSSTLA